MTLGPLDGAAGFHGALREYLDEIMKELFCIDYIYVYIYIIYIYIFVYIYVYYSSNLILVTRFMYEIYIFNFLFAN